MKNSISEEKTNKTLVNKMIQDEKKEILEEINKLSLNEKKESLEEIDNKITEFKKGLKKNMKHLMQLINCIELISKSVKKKK